MVTFYCEREKKKENFNILLEVDVNDNETTDIIDEFCQYAMKEYLKSLKVQKWEQKIYTHKDGKWTETPSNNSRKLDTVILKNDLKEIFKNDLDLFVNSEEWYKERDIPYKKGYLLYGSPGTGKSSIIKAISNYTKRHIHYLMLNEIKDDSSLIELLKSINYKETILVLEDIDAMVEIVKSRKLLINEPPKIDKELPKNEKEQEQNKSNLTLSGLLNALDGIFTTHGRILIMTTNHQEVLDEALIRPGRCDRKFLFNNCDKSQIREIYYLYFNKYPNEQQLSKIPDFKYSPGHITTIFGIYRNEPENVLLHIDDHEIDKN